jgi:type VI secretion system protein ImpG
VTKSSNSPNDNDVLRYYEAEMRYLREAGKEFAQAFPDRAKMLNIDRIGDRDPHVERLFEGFAFLVGRLRQKLDDELPELTEGLVSMLWPHYLQMIPSLSILEITPTEGSLQSHEVLAAGLEVLADPIPVDDERVECVYRTTQAVDLYPVKLTEANAYSREDGRSVIKLRFELQPQIPRAQMRIPRLRLYLNADRPVALSLYTALTAAPLAVHVRIPGYPEDRPGLPQSMQGLRVEAAGFKADERLWPKADNAFGGYQLLLEYFTFPEKFMFVDLVGLDMQSIPQAAPYFDVEIVLAQPYPDDMRFTAENVRLFCTPIINLFNIQADPITVSHFETEYRVHTVKARGDFVEAYSVDSLVGFETSNGSRFEYAPFASFRRRICRRLAQLTHRQTNPYAFARALGSGFRARKSMRLNSTTTTDQNHLLFARRSSDSTASMPACLRTSSMKSRRTATAQNRCRAFSTCSITGSRRSFIGRGASIDSRRVSQKAAPMTSRATCSVWSDWA